MSGTARAFLLGLGSAGVLSGGLMIVLANGAGVTLLILGGLIVASVAFEHRYGRPGARTSPPRPSGSRPASASSTTRPGPSSKYGWIRSPASGATSRSTAIRAGLDAAPGRTI